MKHNKFVKGAFVLIVFNLIGKVIGAFYRIPLAKIVGSVGMGQYQLVFPLYCLVLTIATSGIPVAMSKLVAGFNSQNRFNDSKRLLKTSIILLTTLSAIGSATVIFGARFFAGLQGNVNNAICFYGIAPAVFFVGLLSAFRGYFQGNLIMFPTAFSGLVEQVLKMVLGLFLANSFLEFGTEYAVFGALLGISISELVSVVFLSVFYLCYSLKNKKVCNLEPDTYKNLSRQLLSLSVPITLGGLISPITAMVDSLIVVNLLMFSGFSNETSTMMLGLQSGVVEPLVNIPVIIAVSVSIVLLPSISDVSAEKSQEKIKNIIEKAYQITLSISIACFVCFVIFGEQILSFLYGGSLDVFELQTAMKLLFVGGLNIVFLALVQVTASALQGLGNASFPVKTLTVGCVIKILLDLILVSVKSINILGASIAGGVCYFTVFLLNYRKIKELTKASIVDLCFYISIQECFVCLFAFVVNVLMKMVFSDFVSLIIAGFVAVSIFLVTYFVFFMRDKNNEDFLSENKLT